MNLLLLTKGVASIGSLVSKYDEKKRGLLTWFNVAIWIPAKFLGLAVLVVVMYQHRKELSGAGWFLSLGTVSVVPIFFVSFWSLSHARFLKK